MTGKKWILVLDGPKGAGKSTTAALFKKLHPEVVDISLDFVRFDIGIVGTSFEKNKVAFEEVKKRIKTSLETDKNVLLDCGLNEYRIKEIKSVALATETEPFFVFLTAPYDELVDRVTKRDAAKGKLFNKQRFDEVHKVVMDKNFSDFTTIDTSKNSAAQVVETINALFF